MSIYYINNYFGRDVPKFMWESHLKIVSLIEEEGIDQIKDYGLDFGRWAIIIVGSFNENL